MALGKYSRIDNRRSSSSYCSTVTIVVFVALCLVGVWVMKSSFVEPVESVNVQHEKKDEVKDQVSENTQDNVRQYEDNPGDLPEDAVKDDSDEDSNQDGSNSSDQNNPEEEPEEKHEERTEEKIKEETGGEEETNSEEGSEKDIGENNPEDIGVKTDSGESEPGEKNETEESSEEKQNDSSEGEENSEESEQKSENSNEEKDDSQTEEKVEENENSKSDETTEENNNEKSQNQSSNEVFPSGALSELSSENSLQTGSWSTQASESKKEKEAQKSSKQQNEYIWKLCNVTSGTDYIPCLDNWWAIHHIHNTGHYEHRERHCPEEPPTCLVALPKGYKRTIAWPKSREKIWYNNVPSKKLVEFKGHQNWLKFSGEYLTFPGGGTQFRRGALHYIDFIQKSLPDVAWGKRTRVILDVGCGVASFGGYLFERDVLTMSFAPKDEHEAQVQFALERGIPAVSAVMGTTRLSFPGRVFDAIHCARCRVPWHIEGGKLLLELNRLLRPGGFFLWSATPVYQKNPEDSEIWQAMKKLTKAMCWETLTIVKDTLNGVGIAMYKKPTNNKCYEKRTNQKQPPMCSDADDINAAWNISLEACMHKVPVDGSERGSKWPEQWPLRLEKPPYWLLSSQVGVYGKAAPEDFTADYEHWKRVVSNSYFNGIGIDWKSVRNVMDMRAIYGGFAAALRDLNVWVMNVVSIDDPDTLPIIYERGLFGIYHDWCESFSTYPRTYDLLHADHLFSKLKKRCNILAIAAEFDRILRPEGKLIMRDDVETINELENMVKSMKWTVRFSYQKDNEGLLCVEKPIWRPKKSETIKYAIA